MLCQCYAVVSECLYYVQDVKQIYSYEGAPHIVYVLVDDWGYNDFGQRSTYLSWTTPTLDRYVKTVFM